MGSPFRRFKGMIYPNMAVSFDDSREIAAKKSIPLVCYLRMRRHAVDLTWPDWVRKQCLTAKRDYRQAHFRLKRRAMEGRDG